MTLTAKCFPQEVRAKSAFILPHTLVPQICIGTAGSPEKFRFKKKGDK